MEINGIEKVFYALDKYETLRFTEITKITNLPESTVARYLREKTENNNPFFEKLGNIKYKPWKMTNAGYCKLYKIKEKHGDYHFDRELKKSSNYRIESIEFLDTNNIIDESLKSVFIKSILKLNHSQIESIVPFELYKFIILYISLHHPRVFSENLTVSDFISKYLKIYHVKPLFIEIFNKTIIYLLKNQEYPRLLELHIENLLLMEDDIIIQLIYGILKDTYENFMFKNCAAKLDRNYQKKLIFEIKLELQKLRVFFLCSFKNKQIVPSLFNPDVLKKMIGDWIYYKYLKSQPKQNYIDFMLYELLRKSECKFMRAPINVKNSEIEISSDYLENYLVEIKNLYEIKDFGTSLKIIEELLMLYENSYELHHKKCLILYKSGKLEDGLTAIEEAEIFCEDLYFSDNKDSIMKKSKILRLKRDIYIKQKYYNKIIDVYKDLCELYSKIDMNIISINEKNRAKEIIDKNIKSDTSVQILSDNDNIYIYFFPIELFQELSIKSTF